MTTYTYRGGPLDGQTIELSRGRTCLVRTSTGEPRRYSRFRADTGYYFRNGHEYLWGPDIAAASRAAMARAEARTTTWTYVGGPLDGRRIAIRGRAERWRTITGTPWPWASDPWWRYYEADHATHTYRHIQEDE